MLLRRSSLTSIEETESDNVCVRKRERERETGGERDRGRVRRGKEKELKKERRAIWRTYGRQFRWTPTAGATDWADPRVSLASRLRDSLRLLLRAAIAATIDLIFRGT